MHSGDVAEALVWHLGMHYPAASRHELEVTGVDRALVARKVFVVDGSFCQVCDGLLASMWMIGEASAWSDDEVVEHEEGGEVAQFGSPNASSYSGAGTFTLLNGQEGLLDFAGSGHVASFAIGEERWGNEIQVVEES